MNFKVFLSFCLVFSTLFLFAQTTYPKVVAFAAVNHSIVTFTNSKPTYNFRDYYQVGFPTGVNIWKNAKIGYSLQFIPFIRTEKGVSKMTNLLFHPGVLVALGNGYTFVGRLAFESTGRFGFTPVFSKVIAKGKYSSFFLATPLPVRLGNDKAISFSPSIETGINF